VVSRSKEISVLQQRKQISVSDNYFHK
jgi:hypothetical protein